MRKPDEKAQLFINESLLESLLRSQPETPVESPAPAPEPVTVVKSAAVPVGESAPLLAGPEAAE